MSDIRSVFAILAVLLGSVGYGHAGECDCRDQIDNASAEVSGTCSKVWSNNHCTLKENSSSSASLLRQDFSAAQSRVIDFLDSTQSFDSRQVTDIARQLFDFGYLNELRDRCLGFAEIPEDLFETYLFASLLSVKADANLSLMVSSNLISDALAFSREFDVASMICSDEQIQEGRSFDIDSTYYWGDGCFAGGNESEHFVINFSVLRGCPSGLDF